MRSEDEVAGGESPLARQCDLKIGGSAKPAAINVEVDVGKAAEVRVDQRGCGAAVCAARGETVEPERLITRCVLVGVDVAEVDLIAGAEIGDEIHADAGGPPHQLLRINKPVIAAIAGESVGTSAAGDHIVAQSADN